MATFVAQRHNVDVGQVRLTLRPLRGGLQAMAVAHVAAQFVDRQGRRGAETLVVKRLDGEARREAAIYRSVLRTSGATQRAAVPRLLGIDSASPDRPEHSESCYLYLEAIRRATAWPWDEPARAALVLEQLAALHESLPPRALGDAGVAWNYEAALLDSARTTVLLFDTFGPDRLPTGGRAVRPALRRVVEALPAMRRAVLAVEPFGEVVVHGDAHPGNVLLRRRGAAEQAVLLDWGRARLGSPLEDVSSW
ncbi:MAG: phosphotransferase, partial [Chloroflexota bacterium]